MRKYLLLGIGLLMLATEGHAQRYIVTGTARNSQSKTAIELAGATLMHPDSSFVAGAMTDENGNFRIHAKKAGRFILKLSYVGYTPLLKDIELTAQKDSLGLGELLLSSKDVALGTAVVTATAARVEQKEDTTMFNAAAYRVPEGSTLEALVKQLPGVEIDDNGTIKWNGKEVKEFLVNGKDFFKGDTKIALKNLPTEMVNKIKAYDKKSDYTEQTGIDDGEETTVLDIATKRQLNESWVTNLDVAYGTKDRYSGRFFATRFTDRTRVTAFGSANNTGDRGFGGPRGFRGGGGGLTASKMAGLSFSWENGKEKKEAGRLELNGNVHYSHNSTDLLSTSASETFLTSGATSSFSNSRNRSISSSTNVHANGLLKWSPDTMTTITFRPAFSHSDSHSRSHRFTGTFNDDPYKIKNMQSPLDSIFSDFFFNTPVLNPQLLAIAVNRNRRESLSDSKSNNVSGTLMFLRRFGSKGRNVSLNFSGGYTKGESNSFSISDIRYFNKPENESTNFLNQYTTTPSKNYNYSARLSYTEPLGKQWFAEARYEFSYKYSDNDRSLYNLSDTQSFLDAGFPQYASFGQADGYPVIGSVPTEADALAAVRDDNNSQYATYKYFDHTTNIGVRHNSEKIRFNAGVDFKPQRTEMAYNRPARLDTVVTRHVFNVSPQVRLRIRFSKTNNLDLRYRGSSSQPSMTNLLEVVDDSDPLNISMGNAGLKPAWTNTFRAMYHGYNVDRQQGIMGGMDFSQTSNSISNMMVYDQTTGVRYTRPENISGNWNANGRFMFNSGLGAEKLFTVSTFTNLGYNNSVGYVSVFGRNGRAAGTSEGTTDYDAIFANSNAQKNTTRTWNVGEHLRANYRKSWFDVGVFGNLNYQHSRSRLQENANMDTWNFAYGAEANLTFDWGMSISTDIRMNSRRGYADASMNTNELLWNAQIAQSFLRNKAATISLQFYDILHEQSNVSRTINAQMRSDSWNNAIYSYCMVHFIYKLNIFGGSSKSKGNSNDGPRPGGRMRGPGGGPGGGMPPMRIGF